MKGPLTKPTVKLIGEDGNAFAVMGSVKNALKRAGADQEYIDRYLKEATSGDYDHLLAVSMVPVKIQERLHLRPEPLNDPVIPIGLIHMIGTDDPRISPAGLKRPPRTDVGNGGMVGVGTVCQLVMIKVHQPLAVKGGKVPVQHGRFHIDLGITRPSEPFVTLGAIHWNVEEIRELGPYDITVQLVDQRMPGLKIS